MDVRSGAAGSPASGLARRLAAGELDTPRDLLGAHAHAGGWLVRAWHPDAARCELEGPDGEARPMSREAVDGLFSLRIDAASRPGQQPGQQPGEHTDAPAYRLRFHGAGGSSWTEEDPYRFASTIGAQDLHYFAEGTHRRLWHVLGAHPVTLAGVTGVRFAVWAPGARRVSVVGDFCHWDGRRRPMHRCPESGVFELFVPEARPGDLYKFEILTAARALRIKTDPFARQMERSPGTASRVEQSGHAWEDEAWMHARAGRDVVREPMSIYEVHLGSWRRSCAERGYRAIAQELADHVHRHGFTHVELLPVTEYPFDGSWGYQVSGYFAPTARFGSADDFRAFVDVLHAAGIGVILDWVPAHFPKDDFALRRFDGHPLYEYADPRMGEHPDWGTLVFDFGRNEVRNFLMASALYWLKELHVDGLRVDAVASILYRDYGREDGDWIPNVHGGKENFEAVRFLRELNDAVHQEAPGCFTVAEESTAWPGVTHPTHEGGLGFDLKWNMGWMHDTLAFFSRDAIHRRHHLDQLTFASMYEPSERFLMPLSHDEVVHGKRSLLGRMPGDDWQRFANLRTLFAYQYTRPGKQLLFMGSELAPEGEWAFEGELDWGGAAGDPLRAGLGRFVAELGALYLAHPCFWRRDADAEGFSWVDCSDADQSVVSYVRRDDGQVCLIVLNLTPEPRRGYGVGVPCPGRWRLLLSSDAGRFGGSDHPVVACAEAEPRPMHGHAGSITLDLPPLACLVLVREDAT